MTKKHKTKAVTATARATARRRSVFPPHLSSSPEEWRTIKRQEWNEVRYALGRYAYGSGYTPAQVELTKLERLAQQVTEALESDWVEW